jgi:competence ComEA-like helix-hairpin-helix protein
VILLLLTLLCACARVARRSPPVQDQQLATVANEDNSATRVNLNTAPAADLEELPGIGRVLAERIVVYREQYGPFRRVEHLMMVQGVSDHKFRALRDLVTVE